MFGHKPPMILAEYRLKEKFGWTQAELEDEPGIIIEHYLHIMTLESAREREQARVANG